MADIITLTPELLAAIRETVRREMQAPRNTVGRQFSRDLGQSRDSLYAYFRTGGISGMGFPTTGGAFPSGTDPEWIPQKAIGIQLYAIRQIGTADPYMEAVPGLSDQEVWNVSRNQVFAPGWYPVERDNDGRWRISGWVNFFQAAGTGTTGCGDMVLVNVGAPVCLDNGNLSQTQYYLCATQDADGRINLSLH